MTKMVIETLTDEDNDPWGYACVFLLEELKLRQTAEAEVAGLTADLEGQKELAEAAVREANDSESELTQLRKRVVKAVEWLSCPWLGAADRSSRALEALRGEE